MAHIAVNQLPRTLQSALSALGYGRKDISVDAAESVSPFGAGGNGYREFFVAVNLATGQREERWGSWGGANPFNPTNRVDNATAEYAIPANVAVIKGSIGGGRPVSARIYVRPDAMAPMLPAAPELTATETGALYCYRALKSGQYRQDELRRYGADAATIDGLVSRGLLKRASNGATQITTEGKNALQTALAGRNYPAYPESTD